MLRRRLTFTPPLFDVLWLTILSWLGTMVVVVGIAVGISIFGDVTGSVLDPAAQIGGWFAVFMGGYLNHDQLALHISHGQTRRSFAEMALAFMVAFSLLLGALIAMGYLLERVLYRIAGWPHVVDREHLFSSPTQVPVVLIEYTLLILVWMAAGAFAGAAIYRFGSSGWSAIPAVVLLIDLGGSGFGSGWGPMEVLYRWLSDSTDGLSFHPALAVPAALVAIGIAVLATWPVIRDIPIRQTDR